MPCIICDNGAEICGPDASQSECDNFEGIEADVLPDEADQKCPVGWCLERVCEQDGQKYSIWRPIEKGCLQHAYTKHRGWHERCDRC